MENWDKPRFWDEGRATPRFEWPTHIGVLEREIDAPWVQALEGHELCGAVYRIHYVGRRFRAATLLVVRGPLAAAVDALGATKPLRAEFALAVTPESDCRIEDLRALRDAARARSVAAVHGSDPAAVVLHLVYDLSHDVTLAEALRRLRAQVMGREDALEQVRVRTWAKGLLERVARLQDLSADAHRRLPLVPELARRLGLPPVVDHHLLRARLEDTVHRGGFFGEVHEATTVALVSAEIESREEHERARQLEMAAPEAAPEATPTTRLKPDVALPRHLQARARDAAGAEVCRLVPYAEFEVQVRVGPPAPDWLGFARPMPMPRTPPPDHSGWPLRVVLWDPTYAAEPRIEALLLPELGPSAVVSFALSAGADACPLCCRVIVLDDNEVLQTGILRVPGTGSAPDEVPNFTIDAAPQPVLNRTSEQRWFDGALVLNHGDDGTPRAMTIEGEKIAVVPLQDEGLKKFVELVDRHLSRIATEPDRYDGLRAEGTVELLRELAIGGSALHRRLYFDGALDRPRFRGDGPLQVTAARADAFLPVEFLYRWPAPNDDAVLCADAERALTEGKCPSGCSGDSDRICPLGFWGLFRVLERHTFRPKDAEMSVPFKLCAADLRARDGSLKPLTRALVGASDTASSYDPTSVTQLVDHLRSWTTEVKRIDRWDAWTDQARITRPSLIVLLPHHETRNSKDYLEIGAGSSVLAARITEAHVGGAVGEEAPIVLLIGCETQFARIQFDDFVSAFRFAGARVVVATVATILGRHAARAASRLVSAIHDQTQSGPIRLGEAMLTARRTLLAEGMPMALGLTAYGDADWLLVAAE